MSSDTFQPHTYPEAKHEIRSRRRFKRTKHCSTSRYKLKKKTLATTHFFQSITTLLTDYVFTIILNLELF